MKTKFLILLIICTAISESCVGPKTCRYSLTFTNNSSNEIEFGWYYRSTKTGETVKLKRKESIDFDFWTDENPQKFFPQTADSIIVKMANGKRVIETKKCEAWGVDTATCNPEVRSFFNPKAYIGYKDGKHNKNCGGLEYLFSDEDAKRGI
ncbi:hypothetical protein [Emticicia soli]|uniref:Uncharacterized protein n=1 Tax=Emticicia soli TaxID=2027878 RepID=A0ABW5J3J7_9BACT